jgi:16S rRNA A1518/A1519 N6-dimethyltransferase RsmA/KsgA/DIM1 with predicted DNA glycosylase/AP lyase activity
MKESYDILNSINTQTLFTDYENFKDITVEWFVNKYKTINNSIEGDTPISFNQIFNRHDHKV